MGTHETHDTSMAHTTDEGQVTAYSEATALECDASANPHVVGEALPSVATATLDLYRGAMEAAAKKNFGTRRATKETGVALNARGRGVQLARKECFTQTCRAIRPGDTPLPQPIVSPSSTRCMHRRSLRISNVFGYCSEYGCKMGTRECCCGMTSKKTFGFPVKGCKS